MVHQESLGMLLLERTLQVLFFAIAHQISRLHFSIPCRVEFYTVVEAD